MFITTLLWMNGLTGRTACRQVSVTNDRLLQQLQDVPGTFTRRHVLHPRGLQCHCALGTISTTRHVPVMSAVRPQQVRHSDVVL